jgi:hypothetical protein
VGPADQGADDAWSGADVLAGQSVKVVSKKLPSKGAMKSLLRSGKTLNDYAKATPVNQTAALGPMLQLLRKDKNDAR